MSESVSSGVIQQVDQDPNGWLNPSYNGAVVYDITNAVIWICVDYENTKWFYIKGVDPSITPL